MRVIFAAMAAHGHTYPSVPLALAAHRAGHEVIFAAGEQFVPALRAAGLNAVPAGLSVPAALAGATAAGIPPAERVRHVGHALGDVLTRQWAHDLGLLISARRTDLIVHDIVTLGAALVGTTAGIPVLAHTFGRVDPGEIWRAALSGFASVAAEAGIDSRNLPARAVDICPPTLQAAHFLAITDRLPLRPTGWSPPGAVPPARNGRPLVYVTIGTALGAVDVLRQCVDGLARLPVDVLVATGSAIPAAALGDVPDNVRVETWVEQAALLPRVDLVVHHGGSGTMLGALAAGRPQLFVPQAADQFGNADAVVAAGAGARLLPDELSGDAVTEHARALLADQAVHAAARHLAEQIAAMPSPDEVVATLSSAE